MHLIDRLRNQAAQFSHEALRAEMSEHDPDYARVREVHHAAINTLTAKRAAEGMAIRKERRFWERHGLPGQQHDDG